MNFGSSEVYGFERRRVGLHTMPLRVFILVLTTYIVGGLALAGMIASYTYGMAMGWMWLVGYFALAIPGIFLSAKSDNWLVSTFGYLLVVIPTGAIIGPYVALYTMESVVHVLFITMGATTFLGIAGAVYPKSVEHWGGFLLMGLLMIIFADVARIFMVGFGLEPVTLGVIDYVAAALFCGFIFYDMNRAVRMDYTLDNAVDAAVSLYLDIINLFIRLLAIMGKKD